MEWKEDLMMDFGKYCSVYSRYFRWGEFSDLISVWMWNILCNFTLWSSGEAPSLRAPNNNAPFSCSLILRPISPQCFPKIVQKLHTSTHTTDINNAHVKITETAKKVWRKPHITNRKWGANTLQKWKHRFLFLLLAEQNQFLPRFTFNTCYSTSLLVLF